MGKIYAIIREHYMPNLDFMPFGELEFAFDSREKAEKQMMDIKSMINKCEWYANTKNHVTHEVEYLHIQEPDVIGTIMKMKVNHSNGTFSVYRLQEKELNRGNFDD